MADKKSDLCLQALNIPDEINDHIYEVLKSAWLKIGSISNGYYASSKHKRDMEVKIIFIPKNKKP